MLRSIITTALLCTVGAGAARAQTVREWFRMAPCAEGASLQPGAHRRVVVDQRNGWLQVSEDDEAGTTERTFAIFRQADGTRIFACHTAEEGPEDDQFRLAFYALRDGKMEAVADRLVPELDLEDFIAPGTRLPARRYRGVNLRYVLPRVGTTIRVEPHAIEDWPRYVYEVEPGHDVSAEELDRYVQMVLHSRYRAIELAWNRDRGVFTVARKIPR
ncbi:MAG TPA: hypothetical protein VF771_20595 [Longimicrobiaceae bacterium]